MGTGKPEKIEWENPPERKRAQQGSVWDPVAAALKSRPGKWARIVENGPTGIASVIRGGGLVCFRPKGSFETRVGNYTERWIADVYARYVGERGEYTNVE